MPPGDRSPPPRRLLLLGWDSADWKVASPLIDAGQMPHFANLIEQGAAGNLASLPPHLPPMLWNSIATGKRPYQHGILGYACADPQTGQLRPTTNAQRRCKALWSILSERGRIAHVVGWPGSHPAENVTGVGVSEAFASPAAPGAPWPVPAGAVHPPGLTAELAALRVRAEEIDAGVLRLLIPQIDAIDLRHDQRPMQLATRLAELYTRHNTAIALVDRGPWDFLAVGYHFLAWASREFMEFHPPRRPHIAEREYSWYTGVLAGAYRLLDLLLGDLLRHAGPGVAVLVCSEHGFHSDAQRPARSPRATADLASWQRPQGLVGLAGPGIVSDVLLQGASLLDVAPTVLHYFDLPVGADMDGRVLTAAFAAKTPVAKIPSWETAAALQPRPRHLITLSASDEAALLGQSAALGQLWSDTRGPESPAARHERENRWHLALSYRHAGRETEALELLEALHFAFPEEPRYAFQLALSQLQLGLIEEAEAALATLRDYAIDDPATDLLLAEIALERDDAAGALAQIRTAAARASAAPGLAGYLGRALLKLERWAEAAEAFRAALTLNADDPIAWSGLAQAYLRAGITAEAEKCTREALGLDPGCAPAAFTLGQALIAQGRKAEAVEALERAHALAPGHAAIRQLLDELAGRPFVAAALADTRPAELARLRTAAAQRREQRRRTRTANRTHASPVARYVPPTAVQKDFDPSAPATRKETAPLTLPAGVRPPWPDELPRLAAAFPQLQLTVERSAVHPLVLVTGGDAERLVGVAGIFRLADKEPTTAGLTFFLRPLHHRTASADGFFAAIRQHARDLGVRTLTVADDLREDDARVAELYRAGFTLVRADEIWRVPLAGMMSRLQRLQARFEAAGRLGSFKAVGLREADLEAVRTLVAAEGLLSREAITLARAEPGSTGNYDGDISTVVLHEGEVVGAMLVRIPESGRGGMVEARVVAPRWRGGLNLPNHLLILRSTEVGRARGHEYTLFTGDTTQATETLQMARRFGGTCAGRALRLALTLAD